MDEETNTPPFFDIEAQVILENASDLDEALLDLEQTYSSRPWKDPTGKIEQSYENYAAKLREKLPAKQSEDLSIEDPKVREMLPEQPEEGDSIAEWEDRTLAALETSKDPAIIGRRDQLQDAVETFATAEAKKQVKPNLARDAAIDLTAGLLNPVAQTIGSFLSRGNWANDFVKQAQRQSSKVSFDTLGNTSAALVRGTASGIGSAIGIMYGTPLYFAAMVGGESVKQYQKAKHRGASTARATGVAGMEAANQAMDYLFGRFFTFGKTAGPAIEQTIAKVGVKAIGEGGTEVLQNRVSDVAESIGARKPVLLKNYTVKDAQEDVVAFAAGAFTGTAVNAAAGANLLPTAQTEASAATEASNEEDFEIEPGGKDPVTQQTEADQTEQTIFQMQEQFMTNPPVEGVVGEAESDIDIAENPEDNIAGASTDTGETIRIRADGTSVRTNASGAVKQAHENITVIPEEKAELLSGLLEKTDPAGVPIANSVSIEEGFVVIDNPYVAEDLTIDSEPVHTGVTIAPDSNGHVIQHSRIPAPQGGLQNKVSISTGAGLASLPNNDGSIGAQAAGGAVNTTLVDEFRESPLISPEVRELLRLDNELTALTYRPQTRIETDERAVEVLNSFPTITDYAIALDTGQLDLKDPAVINSIDYAIDTLDSVAREKKAAGDFEGARPLDNLTAALYKISVGARGVLGQDFALLSRQRLTPALGVRSVANDLVSVGQLEAASATGQTIQQIENIDADLRELDKLISELETQLTEESSEDTDPRLTRERVRVERNLKNIKQQRRRKQTIADIAAKKIAEVQEKLTPEIEDRLYKLFDKLNSANPSGDQFHVIRKELENVIGDLKGIPITNPNRAQLIWMGNVLTGIGSHGINTTGNLILGGVLSPLEIGVTGDLKAATNWASDFWKTFFFDRKTYSLLGDALRGNVEYRRDTATDARELNRTIGKGFTRKGSSDLLKSIQEDMGTGKLYQAYATAPSIALRMLGALDAVSSRAVQKAALSKEFSDKGIGRKDAKKQIAKQYASALKDARTEAKELEDLGLPQTEAWQYRRADEILLEAQGSESKSRVEKKVRRAILQRNAGELGLTGKYSSIVSNAVAGFGATNTGVFGGKSLTNQKQSGIQRVANIVRGRITPRRTDITGESLAPIVIEGIQEGQNLVINGKEVYTGELSHADLIKTLQENIVGGNNIALATPFGGPLKYLVGQFIKTGANMLDISMSYLPAVGTLDALASEKIRNPIDKQAVYAGQVMGLALTAALWQAGGISDDDEGPVHIYGPLLDPKLRAYYKTKGISPYALRVGTQLIYYKDIPGINLVLGGIGGVNDSLQAAKRFDNNPIGHFNWIGSSVMGAMKTGTDMTLFRTLGVLADTFMSNRDQPYLASVADLLTNPLSGWVPASGAFKDLERFMYGDSERPTEFTARAISNIPLTKFFSENKPALNMYGEPVRESVIPFYGRVSGSSKDVFETDWLLRNGYSVAVPNMKLRTTKTDIKQFGDVLRSDDSDYFEKFLPENIGYEYLKQVGPKLKEIINGYATDYPTGYSEKVQKNLDKEIKAMKKSVKNDLLSKASSEIN